MKLYFAHYGFVGKKFPNGYHGGYAVTVAKNQWAATSKIAKFLTELLFYADTELDTLEVKEQFHEELITQKDIYLVP